MITFFTHCRPFEGEFDALQRQAITSWKGAVPGCEVIDVTGRVETNEHGTALVSSIFEVGEREASNDLLCEISSDIVLGADTDRALGHIANVARPFVIGQRWDIDPGADPDTAHLHDPGAVDYFIFRRGTLGEIPPFAVGRTAYDNWLVWAARDRWGLTVIDATEAITAIHVNHGHPEYGDKATMLHSEERRENIRLARANGISGWLGVKHAPYVLNGQGVTERG